MRAIFKKSMNFSQIKCNFKVIKINKKILFKRKINLSVKVIFLFLFIVKYFGLNQKLYQLLIKYNVRASALQKIFSCYVRMCLLAQRSTITALIWRLKNTLQNWQPARFSGWEQLF